MNKSNCDPFPDILRLDIEHTIHEYFTITEVCCLRKVSNSWRSRISDALQKHYRWDVTRRPGVDPNGYWWLSNIVAAKVRVRKIHMVSVFALCLVASATFEKMYFFFGHNQKPCQMDTCLCCLSKPSGPVSPLFVIFRLNRPKCTFI